jgi:hypothetical protein
MTTDPRYPIGPFEPQLFSENTKAKWLRDLKFLPSDLEIAIQSMDEPQLDTPYREGGWTVKQLVHHIADSHMHAYIRFKLALTEETPTISPYEEDAWVRTADVIAEPINVSVTLLHALHRRWHAAIKDLSDEQWQRTLFHPARQANLDLWYMLGLYSWHGRHHVAHINTLKENKGWH